MANPNPDAFENDPGFIYLGITREAKAAATARAFDSKKNCWIADPEEGTVTEPFFVVQLFFYSLNFFCNDIPRICLVW